MFHIILYQPEIPPNAGNIIRLCANSGSRLHMIEPLGFTLEDKLLKRAGLDYRQWADVQVHPTLDTCLARLASSRVFAFSTKAQDAYHKVTYQSGDAFLFGPETRGLPKQILESELITQKLRVPMVAGNRSLNLSNTVALVVYEAWRQLDFAGGQ